MKLSIILRIFLKYLIETFLIFVCMYTYSRCVIKHVYLIVLVYIPHDYVTNSLSLTRALTFTQTYIKT